MASLYPLAVLAEMGLVSYWRLGESSGTAAADSKGSNAGEYKGTPTSGVVGALAGDPNTAVTLSGTQWVVAADSASLDVGDTFSIEIWFKRSATGGEDSLISKQEGAYQLRFDGKDHLSLRKAGTASVALTNVTITDTNWHHVIATKSGSTVHIYLDGVDVTTAEPNQTFVDNGHKLSLGAAFSGANDETTIQQFHGSLDEVAIYNVALSAESALRHFRLGRAVAPGQALLGVGR